MRLTEPKANVVVNNLFGVYTGLGMSTLTFDWAQVAFIGSPLIVPWWALVNVFIGFVTLYWIVTPALYYTNVRRTNFDKLLSNAEITFQTWNTAYLPVSTNTLFDRFGSPYGVTNVLTQDGTLDAAAYAQYSPVYLPVAVIMTYVLYMILATACLVHTALYYGPQIYRMFKNVKAAQTDIHAKLMLAYKEVPWWWYGTTFAIFLAMSLAVNAVSDGTLRRMRHANLIQAQAFDTTLPAWGILLALGLPALYILPGGIIYATSNQNVSTLRCYFSSALKSAHSFCSYKLLFSRRSFLASSGLDDRSRTWWDCLRYHVNAVDAKLGLIIPGFQSIQRAVPQ